MEGQIWPGSKKTIGKQVIKTDPIRLGLVGNEFEKGWAGCNHSCQSVTFPLSGNTNRLGFSQNK